MGNFRISIYIYLFIKHFKIIIYIKYLYLDCVVSRQVVMVTLGIVGAYSYYHHPLPTRARGHERVS